MKRARLRPLPMVVAAAAVSALAPAAQAEVPAYADLPSGHATAPPAVRPPARIEPHEKVPGFFVARPPMPPSVPAGARHVSIVGSAKRAEAIRKSGGFDDGEDAARSVCFSQSRRFFRRGVDRDATDRPQDWEEGMSSQAAVWPKADNNPRGGVTAVHAERLVEDASGARIESVDAWVDPTTRGVRKIASATLPLRLVATATIGGAKVYAARDDRGHEQWVQFVVTTPKVADVPQTTTLVATRPDGSSMHATGCSHLRVGVRVVPNGGAGAIVATTLVLPPRDAKPAARARDDDDEAAAPDLRIREANVQLSVSQTSRDQTPVVSVSFGWAGRETTQPAMLGMLRE